MYVISTSEYMYVDVNLRCALTSGAPADICTCLFEMKLSSYWLDIIVSPAQ